MSTISDYPRLIEQLDDVRDRWRLLQVGEGALRLLAAAAVLVAAVVVLAAYATSPRFGNGLSRVLTPWADIPPYTSTQVTSVKPGNKQVIEGQSVPIAAQFAGRLPDSARVFIGSNEKPWKAL